MSNKQTDIFNEHQEEIRQEPNYKACKNSAGICYKVCLVCNYESKNFWELTSDRCAGCGVYHTKGVR